MKSSFAKNIGYVKEPCFGHAPKHRLFRQAMSTAATIIFGSTQNATAENNDSKYIHDTPCLLRAAFCDFDFLLRSREPDSRLMMTAAQHLIQQLARHSEHTQTEFKSRLESDRSVRRDTYLYLRVQVYCKGKIRADGQPARRSSPIGILLFFLR
jgi:hypothetical protein